MNQVLEIRKLRLSRAPFWMAHVGLLLAMDVWGIGKTLFVALLAFAFDRGYDWLVWRWVAARPSPETAVAASPQQGEGNP